MLCAVLLLAACAPRMQGTDRNVLREQAGVAVELSPASDTLEVRCGDRPRQLRRVVGVSGRVIRRIIGDTVDLRLTAVRTEDAETEVGMPRGCKARLLRDATTAFTVPSRNPRRAQLRVAGTILAYFAVLIAFAALAFSGPD